MTQADDADDVAGRDRIDLAAMVGLDSPQLRHVFLLVLAGIQHAAVRLQRAGVNADVVQIAVPVGLNLEHQAAKRLVGVGLAEEFRVGLLRVRALDRRNVGGAGQVERHGVQHRLHADPVQRRPAQHRHRQVVDRRLAQHAANQLRRHGLFGQQEFGQRVVVHRKLIEHLAAPKLGLVAQFGGDFRLDDLAALCCR